MPDPLNDRVMKDVHRLCNRPIDDSDLWVGKKNVPNWKLLEEHLAREGPVTKKQVMQILKITLDIVKKEPNMVSVEEPVAVVGDIHGQFFDLITMMRKAGEPDPKTLNYLFLGDYVDRGTSGIEVCLLLFALKIAKPSAMTLLRGNHESRSMTETFTFRDEVL